MADIQANIGIGVDTTQALAAIRQLQREISVFHTLMAKGGADAASKSLLMQQGLINTINETGKFSASMTRVSSSTESFTNALEKNKFSMGQYFRYAGGASKTFGKMFTREFNTINRVATERVKDLQTQYISMGRDANGALQAIKVRPLALDMDNLGTKVMLASQKQQIFNQLMKQGTTNLLNFGKNTQWAGRQLMVGFTIPLTIFGATAAREFQKLEEQAVKFRRVYGDMFTTDADTEKALRNVRELADEFTKYGIAVEKTIGLAAKVAQMGNVGDDLTAQVTQATRLAVLGGLEQEEALDTTISLTNAFGIAAEDLAGKIAFLNAAENQTILAIEDFNEAIPKAGSVVQQLGGDVEDLAFFLTAMREGGINASQAANALKSSLGRLINPTEVAQKELAGFGIDILGIVESNAGNLREMVLELGYALDTLDPLNRARAIEQLFGKFQFARMSTMFSNIVKEGSQASRVLQLTANSTEELAIIAERELKRVEESPAFRLQKQMEQLRAALAPIGEEFIKAVMPLLEFGTKILKSFNNLGDGAKQFIVVITAIAGVVAPAALMAFGLIANGVANLLKFFLFLGNAFGKLSGQSTLLGGQTEYMTQQQIEAAAVAASLGQSHSNLTQIFTSEASAVANLVTQYRAAITAQRQLSVGQTAAGVAARSAVRPQGFASGGLVRGPGTGTSDSIFAMLSNGEAVISAAVVKKYPEAVNQLISGNVPGYSQAGVVGNSQAGGVARGVTFKQAGTAERVSDLRASLGDDADLLEKALEKFTVVLEDGTREVRASYDEIKKAATEQAMREGRETEALSGTKTVRGHVQDPHEPGSPAYERAMRQTGMDKANLPEDIRSGMSVVGNLTAEIPANLNERLKKGVDSDLFGEVWNARTDKMKSSFEAGGLDYSDPENAQAAQQYEDDLGQRAIELAQARAEASGSVDQVMVTDADLAAASRELTQKYREAGGAKANVANAAQNRMDSIGGVRSSPGKETVEKYMEQANPSDPNVKPGPGFVPGKGNELIWKDPNDPNVAIPRLARGGRNRLWTGGGFQPAPEEKSYANYEIQSVVRPDNLDDIAPDSPEVTAAPDPQLIAQGGEDGEGYVNNLKNAVAEGAPNVVPTLLNAGGWSSPHPTWVAQGAEDGEGYQQAFDAAASGTGKPPLPGNLAAPQPPAMPESPKQGRFGKLFSGVKDKINDSKIAQKAADYLSGGDLDDKITVTPPMSDEEREAHRTAKAINQDLYDKGLITEDMQATPLGETQGVTPVRVVDGKIDIGKNSVDDLANASPAAEQAAESDKLTRAVKDNRAAQEEVAEATENLADSTDQKAKQDNAALKEQKRQNRQARAGKALAGLGTMTMVAGMASMQEGAIGQMAQSLMPALTGLTAIAPILMALPGPLAAIVAVLGAGIFLWYKYNKTIDEAREKAYNLTTALGSGEKAMNKFAEFAGTVSSSELLERRVQNIGRIMEIQPGKSTFGQSFVGQESGQEYVKSVEESIATLGESATIALVQRQLSQAILDEVLSLEQARSIVAALGDELGDYGFAIDVSSKLIELVGPNGEDLFNDPLLLTAKIVEEQTQVAQATAQAIAGSIETVTADSVEAIDRFVQDRMAKREAVIAGDNIIERGIEEVKTTASLGAMLGAEGFNAGDLFDPKTGQVRNYSEELEQQIIEAFGVGPEYFVEAFKDPLGQIATDLLAQNLRETAAGDITTLPERKIAADVINAENLGQSLGMVENYFNALQGGLASIVMTADENLAAARESGDPEAIAEALEARDQALLQYAQENEETTRQIEDALLATKESDRVAAFKAQSERMTQDLEGDAKIAMQAILPSLASTTQEEYVTNVKLRGMLEQGDISPNDLLNLIEGKTETEIRATYDLVADLSLDIGEDYAVKAVQLANDIEGVVNENGIDISGQVADSFLNGLASVTPAEAMDNVQAFGDISRWREIFPQNFGEIVQDFASPEALAAFQERQQGFVGLDFTDDAAVSEAMTGPGKQALQEYIAAEGEAWDALDQASKEEFATILDVAIGYSGETWLVDLLKSQQEGDDTEAVTFGKLIEQRLPSRTEVSAPGTEETTTTPTGSGAEPQIDSLIKKLRDLRLATIDMKKGWEGMQEVLQSVFAGGTQQINVFDGLSNQIRRLGVGENLIEMIVGMDPDEYEKRKNELFIFDTAGNITGATAALKNMNSAFNAVALGEYVNGQQSFIEKTKNQISAIRILTANGLALADAYEVVQDAATAAAIAQGASAEQIQELIRFTKLAKEQEEELEEQRERSRISESVRKTNEEFANQVAVLQKLSKAQGQYTDEQVKALMSDKDLQSIFLDPSIDPGALEAALRNAEQKANLEVQIAIAEGREDELFGNYLNEINDYFSKAEAKINVDFEMETAADQDIITEAQNQIADIQYQLDDYNAELEQISWAEDDINEKYDKRAEALDEIANVNERIANQQKAQLDIADALSKGDIAAAARATAELRSQQAQDAQESQKEQLDRAREAELKALTGPSGMTREQLEDAIQALERQLFFIEEQTLEPAQERVRLAEIARNLAVEQLELNEMTRDEFDAIAAATNLAAINMEEMAKSAEKLIAMAEFIQTGTKPANWEELFPTPKAASAPAPSGGGGGGGSAPVGKRDWQITSGEFAGMSLQKAAESKGFGTWQEFYNTRRDLDAVLTPANGGLIGKYAMGGIAKKSRSGPPLQMAMGGKVGRYAAGGMIIPKRMAMGGYSMGSDIVPAILTPGEFVVRRPAVSAFGVDKLEKINRGTYNDGSMYNYNLAVNVRSDADPNKIARTVMTSIKSIENQRIRGNKL